MSKQVKFQTAVAEVEITPDFPVTLIGGMPTRSKEVLHPLMSQVLLMKWGNDLTCLITIDNLGLTVELANKLRQTIATQLGITKAEVMLCFSHTHNAPQPTVGALNGERYFSFMEQQISLGVIQALAKLQPSKIGWGLTKSQLGVNRRVDCSVVDDRLGVLKIATLTGKPLVVVLRLTAHPNSLMSLSGVITSDYFHFVRQQLTAHCGCPVMVIQGAAGNVKVRGTDTITGGTLLEAEAAGKEIAEALVKMTINLVEVSEFQLISRELPFTSEVPSVAESQLIAHNAQKECGIDGAGWLAECQRLREAGLKQQVTDREVQFLTLNEGQFCGVADELFCELALQAAEKTTNRLFFLNGYTNGCTGYLPTEREWLKGGYEILYSNLSYFPFHGHVMPFRPETAAQLVEFVVEHKC